MSEEACICREEPVWWWHVCLHNICSLPETRPEPLWPCQSDIHENRCIWNQIKSSGHSAFSYFTGELPLENFCQKHGRKQHMSLSVCTLVMIQPWLNMIIHLEDALTSAIFGKSEEGGMSNISVLVRILSGAIYWKPKQTGLNTGRILWVHKKKKRSLGSLGFRNCWISILLQFLSSSSLALSTLSSW